MGETLRYVLTERAYQSCRRLRIFMPQAFYAVFLFLSAKDKPCNRVGRRTENCRKLDSPVRSAIFTFSKPLLLLHPTTLNHTPYTHSKWQRKLTMARSVSISEPPTPVLLCTRVPMLRSVCQHSQYVAINNGHRKKKSFCTSILMLFQLPTSRVPSPLHLSSPSPTRSV